LKRHNKDRTNTTVEIEKKKTQVEEITTFLNNNSVVTLCCVNTAAELPNFQDGK